MQCKAFVWAKNTCTETSETHIWSTAFQGHVRESVKVKVLVYSLQNELKACSVKNLKSACRTEFSVKIEPVWLPYYDLIVLS